MKGTRVMEALLSGKRVARSDWMINAWWQLKDNKIVNELNDSIRMDAVLETIANKDKDWFIVPFVIQRRVHDRALYNLTFEGSGLIRMKIHPESGESSSLVMDEFDSRMLVANLEEMWKSI
jgi:hypothetical protein